MATIIDGTGGNDSLFGTNKADIISGKAGDDVADGLDGNDDLNGGGDNDNLDGGRGNDTLDGGGKDDILSGGNDKDTIFGGSGSDVLSGGGDNDTIVGGGGNDTLTGGKGDDIFQFNKLGEGIDTITDFDTGNDTIDIVQAGFAELNLGTLPAFQFVLGAVAVAASDRFIYNSGGDLFFDQDGNGADPQVLLATLTGTSVPTLTAADIIII